MKTIKLAILASVMALAAVPAFAADMALKAPPPAVASGAGAGWYVGLGVEGALASSSVSGTNFAGISASNLTADGGTLGVDVGYIWNNCVMGTWCQLELDGKWQNISGTNGVGSVNSQYSVSEEVDVGVQPLTTILAALNLQNPFPTFNPSSLLPSAIAVATTPREYVGFVADEMQINGTFGSASGQTWAFAPGVKTGYRWATLNAAGTPNGGSLNVYAEILFPTRGATISNVFAAGGPPISLNSSAGMSDIYLAGIHYDFGIPSR